LPRPQLSERHRRVVNLLVREYIEHGVPVSSIWLAEQGGLHISSATVRNILSRLEESGYLRQPHTSAGRIPTDLAYRCYVDHLLSGRRHHRVSTHLPAGVRGAVTLDQALASASQELSRASHHVGFAVPPPSDGATLREIQFVPLASAKILVIVVSGDGHVSHKVVDLGEPLRPEDLSQAAAYLAREFRGHRLATIRETIVRQLAEERTLYDALRARALRLASSSFDDLATPSLLFIQGASSLLDDADAETRHLSRATLRALFEMIEEKHRLVRLLTEYIEGPGVTVVIGSEHSTPDLQDFSLVASTYSDGRRAGTVGVLGPTRMRYSRAIGAVERMATTLNRMFQ
jgi:heat-inducible transcriptional repressor